MQGTCPDLVSPHRLFISESSVELIDTRKQSPKKSYVFFIFNDWIVLARPNAAKHNVRRLSMKALTLQFDDLGEVSSGNLHFKYKFSVQCITPFPANDEPTYLGLRAQYGVESHDFQVWCTDQQERDKLVATLLKVKSDAHDAAAVVSL